VKGAQNTYSFPSLQPSLPLLSLPTRTPRRAHMRTNPTRSTMAALVLVIDATLAVQPRHWQGTDPAWFQL